MKKKITALLGCALLSGMCIYGKTIKINQNYVLANSLKQTQSIDCINETSEKHDNVNLKLRAKSAYVADYATGTVVYKINEQQRLPIASMCKIMTLLLAFEGIDEGILHPEEEILVSERAASMGGSQVFLEANAKYPIKELLKSIAVCSANDSCVAVAERLCGSEDLFVDKMNEKAKELGATDTLFSNCTGLPKDPQYSCAKDVFLMLKALLSHKEYFDYGNVWMDKFAHPKGRYTEISNTNKLVRYYDGCDGGKTGFTNQAGFCLAATAKRNGTRIISVVIGEENSKNRFDDVRTTFDYAFANYTTTPIVEANVPLEKNAHVTCGKEKEVDVCPKRSAYAFVRRGDKSNFTIETVIQPLRAPIKKGDTVGEIIIYQNNVEYDKVPLIATSDVEKADYFDCLKEVARGWNKRF